MRITTRGQVTIPSEIRDRLGLLPHTQVEFELAGDHVFGKQVADTMKADRGPGPLTLCAALPTHA